VLQPSLASAAELLPAGRPPPGDAALRPLAALALAARALPACLLRSAWGRAFPRARQRVADRCFLHLGAAVRSLLLLQPATEAAAADGSAAPPPPPPLPAAWLALQALRLAAPLQRELAPHVDCAPLRALALMCVGAVATPALVPIGGAPLATACGLDFAALVRAAAAACRELDAAGDGALLLLPALGRAACDHVDALPGGDADAFADACGLP